MGGWSTSGDVTVTSPGVITCVTRHITACHHVTHVPHVTHETAEVNCERYVWRDNLPRCLARSNLKWFVINKI